MAKRIGSISATVESDGYLELVVDKASGCYEENGKVFVSLDCDECSDLLSYMMRQRPDVVAMVIEETLRR